VYVLKNTINSEGDAPIIENVEHFP